MKEQKIQRKRGSNGQHDPDPKMIAQRAHELYLERGGDHGHDFEDWLQAERELRRGEAFPGKMAG